MKLTKLNLSTGMCLQPEKHWPKTQPFRLGRSFMAHPEQRVTPHPTTWPWIVTAAAQRMRRRRSDPELSTCSQGRLSTTTRTYLSAHGIQTLSSPEHTSREKGLTNRPRTHRLFRANRVAFWVHTGRQVFRCKWLVDLTGAAPSTSNQKLAKGTSRSSNQMGQSRRLLSWTTEASNHRKTRSPTTASALIRLVWS